MGNLLSENTLLVAEWHPDKNGALNPSKITQGSGKKVWWLGKCGHEWDAQVNNRSNGSSCPFCSNIKILVGFNDIAATNPKLAAEIHPSRNDADTQFKITDRSSKRIWWIGECSHEWLASPNDRSRFGCPYCSGNKVLEGFNDLETIHPAIAKQWHPTKNGNLIPSQFSKGSGKKVWWIGKCGHEFFSSISEKIRSCDKGCPICYGREVLQDFNDLASLHPEIAKLWHPTKNNELSPKDIVAGGKRKVWWICKKKHSWTASVQHVTRGSGCPYCAGKKVLAGFNDLATLNPDLSQQWHPNLNGSLTPQQLTLRSHVLVWWICKKSHEWQARVDDRFRNNCPSCRANNYISKAEHAIAQFLMQKGIAVKQSERSLLRKMELDIYLPEHNMAIEFNGVYWHSEAAGKNKTYHYDKFLAAKNAGIQLIQIWEDEWNRNPEQIKVMLLHKLGKSKREKVYARNTVALSLAKDETVPFLQQNHIQGYASGSYYLGLRDKFSCDTIAVMVLTEEAGNTLNIIRYATSKKVLGGFTKLLSYAEKEYSPDCFITSSDNCVSDGALYASNGFIIDKEIGPDYMYVVQSQRKHKSDYGIKRFHEDPNLQWVDGMTEAELAKLNNLNRIWDAGKIHWLKCRNGTGNHSS